MTENAYIVKPWMPELLEDVGEIEHQSFSSPWSTESLRSAAEREDSVFLTVCHEERAVAFGCILLVAGEGELVDIAVSPAHRKKGLGEMLLRSLIEEARRQGAEQIYLEVRESNTPARKLYEKNGFVSIGCRKKYYKDPVEDAVLMQLDCRE